MGGSGFRVQMAFLGGFLWKGPQYTLPEIIWALVTPGMHLLALGSSSEDSSDPILLRFRRA